jgi:protein O-mannosyl-transferase
MEVNTIDTEVFVNHLRDTLRNPDNRICFILGAGASVESGISSGAELAKQWYRELPTFHSQKRIDDWKAEVEFNENDIPAHYAKLFRLRYEGQQDNGIHHITSIIEKGSPGFGYTILSQVLQRTPHNVVVTTNFDTLTEESLYVFTNKRALVCNHENLAHLAKPSSTRPLVVKIHRGLYMDPLNDEKDIAEIKPEWKKTLTSIFQNYIPIVIGYGGNDDSLMNYLGSIEPCQRMYWCIRGSSKPKAEIIKVVQRHRGSFVTTDGFNRLMFRFIDLFDLTKMHEVLEQTAKDRAEKLRSEFEEAGKNIGLTGTVEEKTELGKVADDFDKTDWLQWELKASAASNPEDIKAIYTQALEILPNSRHLYYNLGCNLHQWGEYDEAIAAYKKAIEIKPDDYEAWNNMGYCYINKGQYDEAIKACNEAIKIKPDKFEAWRNLGISYDKKGQYDEAIIVYRKIIEINPSKHEIWYNMGNSYHKKGEYGEATTAYKKAIEIKPSYDKAWYNMGNSYKQKGEIANARKCYAEAFRLKPDDPDYKKALDGIEGK